MYALCWRYLPLLCDSSLCQLTSAGKSFISFIFSEFFVHSFKYTRARAHINSNVHMKWNKFAEKAWNFFSFSIEETAYIDTTTIHIKILYGFWYSFSLSSLSYIKKLFCKASEQRQQQRRQTTTTITVTAKCL